jgi:hypothetical protein
MAEDYPLGRLMDEAAMCVERENNRIITEQNLINLSVVGFLSQKARSAFTKSMKRLTVEVRPRSGLFDD